jgi:hypothetical protein
VPGYGVDLFEDDYLFLLPAADLRMDPALRPRPVSSLTSVTLHNSTTRLNDGIFRVHRLSAVTPTRLHKSDFVFRFYVYDGTFDNPQGDFLSARGTVFGALCAYGFFGFVRTTSVFSVSVSDFMVWDGGLHTRGAIARLEAGFFYLVF